MENEQRANKRSILRHLNLAGIDGITKPHAVRECISVDEHEIKEVWKTYYHYDMTKLFKRFELDDSVSSVAAAPGSMVDCEADIAEWERRVEEAEDAALVAAAEIAEAAARANAEVAAAEEGHCTRTKRW